MTKIKYILTIFSLILLISIGNGLNIDEKLEDFLSKYNNYQKSVITQSLKEKLEKKLENPSIKFTDKKILEDIKKSLDFEKNQPYFTYDKIVKISDGKYKVNNLEINFIIGKSAFPTNRTKKPINGTGESLDKIEYERSLNIIIDSLNKYSPEVIENNLEKIYFVKSLSFYNLNYGGTYYGKTLYIVNSGLKYGYNNNRLEGTIHHEFSSILLKNYSKYFNEDNWDKSNTQNFTYGSGGISALQLGKTNTEINSEYIKKGFLTQYSMASIEEDFNVFASYIFRGYGDFWEATKTNQIISNKKDVFINFYSRIDPVFTENYFKSFSKDK